jgi:hypothetical protein
MWPRVPWGLDEIIATFGNIDDPDFETKYITSFVPPYPIRYEGQVVKSMRCHRLLVPVFLSVFTEIKNKGLADLASEYSGIYQPRPIRGFKSYPSTHSWGIAIDINAESNPLGSETSTMDMRIVKIFKHHGFFWGGKFKKRKDPMHFQYARAY